MSDSQAATTEKVIYAPRIRRAEAVDAELVLTLLKEAMSQPHHSPVSDEEGARKFIAKSMKESFVAIGEDQDGPAALLIAQAGSEEWSDEVFLEVRVFYVRHGGRYNRFAVGFMVALREFADMHGYDISLTVGAKQADRMFAGRGVKSEYRCLAAVFVRRAYGLKEDDPKDEHS